MGNTVRKLQQALKEIIGNYDDPLEIDELTVFSDEGAVIQNAMKSEEIATVVCTLLKRAKEIAAAKKELDLVPMGRAGKSEILREDYLPYEGRFICRLAHEAGYQIWLSPAGCWQEAIIVVSDKIAIRLEPGKERRRKKVEPLDEELRRDQEAITMGS